MSKTGVYFGTFVLILRSASVLATRGSFMRSFIKTIYGWVISIARKLNWKYDRRITAGEGAKQNARDVNAASVQEGLSLPEGRLGLASYRSGFRVSMVLRA